MNKLPKLVGIEYLSPMDQAFLKRQCDDIEQEEPTILSMLTLAAVIVGYISDESDTPISEILALVGQAVEKQTEKTS